MAKELRLDVVYSPYAERTEKHTEVNVLSAINTLLDLFELVVARRGSSMSDLGAGAAVAPEEIEKSEHERYI